MNSVRLFFLASLLLVLTTSCETTEIVPASPKKTITPQSEQSVIPDNEINKSGENRPEQILPEIEDRINPVVLPQPIKGILPKTTPLPSYVIPSEQNEL